MGYTMTADEVSYWQDQAALLDPLAYEFVIGSGQSRTVPTGERWYLVNAWNVAASGSGVVRFHRTLHVERATPLSAGTTIVTGASAGHFMYLCKPAGVIAADSRYTSDPRGLYFDRMTRMADLTQYHLGVTATDGANHTADFPTDFDYGMLLEVSSMDLAWVVLDYVGSAAGMNTFHEVSDLQPLRTAEACVVPFDPDLFPKIKVRGVSLSTGAGNVVYVKLPADW